METRLLSFVLSQSRILGTPARGDGGSLRQDKNLVGTGLTYKMIDALRARCPVARRSGLFFPVCS